MRVDTAEIRRGIAETRGFVLSHHLPEEYYRCYSPVVFGRQLHICARCVGIYPGILAGLFAYAVAPPPMTSVVLVALVPLPALVDWAVTTFTTRRGYNVVRTVTGSALGYGYGLGVGYVFVETNPFVIGVGVLYGLVAAVLLFRSNATDE
ncbi:DUF2085 domain-containing protein [Natrarchaeobius halalkaliphilus]|uniref:DUF2085 domain-containing protein n=1 Tax=Natrarchaeobius halalkaliphilus TaxID=1679091 RepID=A0A3N6LTC5_9EURY|nr:DUF2085 domain-containing protein [Natrarchaeobius halalkaliphilus]RQG93318.1 DUF2085 domain-containing protein [Natrarchaeobius halalkaliphilus]